MATDTTNPKERVKVELKQGRHLADWVRVNGSMPRGNGTRRITAVELAKHNTKEDAWTAYDGRVYNITQYLPYHPGGEKRLMQGVGIDCTVLFNRHHRWVNGHAMLSNCLMGIYVGDSETMSSGAGDSSSLSIPTTTKKPEPKLIQKSSDIGFVAPTQVMTQALAQLELHDEKEEGGNAIKKKEEEEKVVPSTDPSGPPPTAPYTEIPPSESNTSKKADGSCNVI
jgi:cytochrome b involved in lipid metabolism